MEFMPSDVARLVYGYLQEKRCTRSATSFRSESQALVEFNQLLDAGSVPSTRVFGRSLLDLLNLLGKFLSVSEHLSISQLDLFNQLETVLMKLFNSTRPTESSKDSFAAVSACLSQDKPPRRRGRPSRQSHVPPLLLPVPEHPANSSSHYFYDTTTSVDMGMGSTQQTSQPTDTQPQSRGVSSLEARERSIGTPDPETSSIDSLLRSPGLLEFSEQLAGCINSVGPFDTQSVWNEALRDRRNMSDEQLAHILSTSEQHPQYNSIRRFCENKLASPEKWQSFDLFDGIEYPLESSPQKVVLPPLSLPPRQAPAAQSVSSSPRPVENVQSSVPPVLSPHVAGGQQFQSSTAQYSELSESTQPLSAQPSIAQQPPSAIVHSPQKMESVRPESARSQGSYSLQQGLLPGSDILSQSSTLGSGILQQTPFPGNYVLPSLTPPHSAGKSLLLPSSAESNSAWESIASEPVNSAESTANSSDLIGQPPPCSSPAIQPSILESSTKEFDGASVPHSPTALKQFSCIAPAVTTYRPKSSPEKIGEATVPQQPADVCDVLPLPPESTVNSPTPQTAQQNLASLKSSDYGLPLTSASSERQLQSPPRICTELEDTPGKVNRELFSQLINSAGRKKATRALSKKGETPSLPQKSPDKDPTTERPCRQSSCESSNLLTELSVQVKLDDTGTNRTTENRPAHETKELNSCQKESGEHSGGFSSESTVSVIRSAVSQSVTTATSRVEAVHSTNVVEDQVTTLVTTFSEGSSLIGDLDLSASDIGTPFKVEALDHATSTNGAVSECYGVALPSGYLPAISTSQSFDNVPQLTPVCAQSEPPLVKLEMASFPEVDTRGLSTAEIFMEAMRLAKLDLVVSRTATELSTTGLPPPRVADFSHTATSRFKPLASQIPARAFPRSGMTSDIRRGGIAAVLLSPQTKRSKVSHQEASTTQRKVVVMSPIKRPAQKPSQIPLPSSQQSYSQHYSQPVSPATWSGGPISPAACHSEVMSPANLLSGTVSPATWHGFVNDSTEAVSSRIAAVQRTQKSFAVSCVDKRKRKRKSPGTELVDLV